MYYIYGTKTTQQIMLIHDNVNSFDLNYPYIINVDKICLNINVFRKIFFYFKNQPIFWSKFNYRMTLYICLLMYVDFI